MQLSGGLTISSIKTMYFAHMHNGFSYLWLLWLIIFVVVELIALYRGRNKDSTGYTGGTLSEVVWRLSRSNKLFMIAFAGLWLVLTYHFFFD